MWFYLQGEMGKSGERGHEGEPGTKVLMWLSFFNLFLFIHIYLRCKKNKHLIIYVVYVKHCTYIKSKGDKLGL